MKHLDSRGLVFITEAKSNRLVEDNETRMQARDYLACHQNEFRRIKRPRTEYRWYHKVVSEIKGGITVKFVFLKQRLEDRALVLIINALDLDVQDVICSHKRRWDIEVYYGDCKQCLGMGEYLVRRIDVGVLHLLLVNLAYTLLKSIVCSCFFRYIFKGAESIGAMCEALKRFATMRLARSSRERG